MFKFNIALELSTPKVESLIPQPKLNLIIFSKWQTEYHIYYSNEDELGVHFVAHKPPLFFFYCSVGAIFHVHDCFQSTIAPVVLLGSIHHIRGLLYGLLPVLFACSSKLACIQEL